MDKLNIFFTEVQQIYNDNCELKKELELLKNNSSNNEINLTLLIERNKEMENIIKSLEQKNSSKSSKMIWENTQQIIQDKDKEIDFLKKKLMYYERQNLIKSQSSANVINDTISTISAISTSSPTSPTSPISSTITTSINLINNDKIELDKEINVDNKKIILEEKPKKKKLKKIIKIIDNDDLEKDLLAT
jgi:hypothetical protein